MSTILLQVILILDSLLSLVIFFMYRSFGWPLGREGIEAIVSFLVILITTICYRLYLRRTLKRTHFQSSGARLGLIFGLVWTVEICMNNLIRPGLPGRDYYDDIFWAIIAAAILTTSTVYAFTSKKVRIGVITGIWTGFASGAVACLTALLFIVFGMSQILLDPLNISEWSARGTMSNTPNIAVYFAYQTLAGAVLHLIVLGLLMGLLLGVIGGLVGKNATLLLRKN